MLVKDLIEQLQQLDQNATICVYNNKDNFTEIEAIDFTYGISHKYKYVIEYEEEQQWR